MRLRIMQICAAAATVVLLLMSCSKHKLGVDSGSVLTVIASGNLVNAVLGQETIVRAELLLDGKIINTVDCAPPCGAVTLVGMKESVKPGHHTVAFRVANQSSSPNAYETVGATVETLESRFELGGLMRSLATGEWISYDVDLSH